ncbi:MAG: gephyrin-like molybdotransferase Glp [Acidobacteriota bacterium]
MLSPEDAWNRIETELALGEPEETSRPARVEVTRGEALGRVLAEPVAATLDQPFADVSSMDGFALAGPVTRGAVLPVVGESAAGHPPTRSLSAGEAMSIMTGAMLPGGADRVVPVERIERVDADAPRPSSPAVRIDDEPAAGTFVRRQGEVVRRGDPLLEVDTLLTPAALSLLASHGVARVAVRRAPTVAVLATGDEVVPADDEPAAGQLRDSNSPFLAAALSTLGLVGTSLGIAPDRRDALAERIRAGLEHDVLLLCGGVSKGEYDFVEDELDALGCRRLFDAVAVQPGKPLVVARHARGWVFGLPGNPASVMTTFWLFVRPLLRRLLGRRDGFWHGAVPARAGSALPPTAGRDRFLPATVHRAGDRLEALPTVPRGSHDVSATARATALLRLPAHSAALPAGSRCEVLPLADWPFASP